MRVRSLCSVLSLECLLCVLIAPRALRAQDVRDVVREHLEEQLEGHDEPKPDKPKSEPRKHATPRKPARDQPGNSAVEFSASTDAVEPAPAPDTGPPLPLRILGDYVRLDIQLGGGFRGWVPQQFPHVDVSVGSYYVWTIDVQAKLFKRINLHRGYYESNGLSGPRTDEAAVAAQVGSYIPKAAWLLGVLGFPLFKAWEPILRYESRAFRTSAHPERPVCVVTDAVARDLSSCARSSDALKMTSGFETFVAGVRYDASKQPSAVLEPSPSRLPPITIGLGLMSYRKPYQVNVNGNTLEGYLFDGRFRGAGLMLGADWKGGPDRVFFNVDAQLGLGEVKLTRSLTLNSLAPEDWLMGYVLGNATFGYYWTILRGPPTVMLVPKATLGGASFFFFKTERKQGEDADAAAVNWDFLWSANASLVVSL